MSLIAELKRRNVFRVGVAYAIVAWLLIEVASVLLPTFDAPDWVMKAFSSLVILGFPLALIVAWAFELTPEGIKRETAVEPAESITQTTGRKIDFIIIAVLAAAIVFLAVKIGFEDDSAPPDTAAAPDKAVTVLPLVLMMDSYHPTRVYDDETVAAGGTNADVVSDILLDLPIRRQKEGVGPEWKRDEEILGFRPDLIIIHYSAFRQEDDAGPRNRLRLLVEYFADSDTRFLVYGRRDEAWLREAVEELLTQLDREHPGLLERVHVFGLLDYGGPSWRDPTTAASLKLFVKRILAID